jgi:hypothetical protein
LSRFGIITPRLLLELAVYAVIGLMAWRTLYVEKFRLVALVVLASFAVRTVLRSVHQSRYPEQPDSAEDAKERNRE